MCWVSVSRSVAGEGGVGGVVGLRVGKGSFCFFGFGGFWVVGVGFRGNLWVDVVVVDVVDADSDDDVLCDCEYECECGRIFDNENEDNEVSDCRAFGCERGGKLGRSSGTRVEFNVSVVVDGKLAKFKYGAGRSLVSGGVIALGVGLAPGILYIADEEVEVDFAVEVTPIVDVRDVVSSVCIKEADPEMEAESGLEIAIESLDCVGGRGSEVSRDALRSLPFPWRR
ncbi:hypothetical protein BJX62DRAFT_220366 [Aspergillus germanicus]